MSAQFQLQAIIPFWKTVILQLRSNSWLYRNLKTNTVNLVLSLGENSNVEAQDQAVPTTSHIWLSYNTA